MKDLTFKNIRILDDPEETILVIEAPRVAEEVAAEEELSEFAEPQEPEVIGEKKESEESEE